MLVYGSRCFNLKDIALIEEVQALDRSVEWPASSARALFFYLESVVLVVAHWLEPFVAHIIARNGHGQMRKPAVACGTMPVLHLGRYVHHVAGQQQAGGLAPLLIPATAGHTHELTAALVGVVDVPVVAASRLERDVVYGYLLGRDGSEVALPDEILGIGRMWARLWEIPSRAGTVLCRRMGRRYHWPHTSLASLKAAHALGQPA